MQRYNDVITNSDTEPELLYTFHDFPVNMLLPKGDVSFEHDNVFDMKFGIFPDSGVIQLLELVHEDMVYVDTHSNAVGGIWKRQHETLANLIHDVVDGMTREVHILEIGGVLG